MKLNPNELEFILDGIRFFGEDEDDYYSYDGKYNLTVGDINNLFTKLTQEKHSIENQ